MITKDEAERLATRLEAEDNRKEEFRYALVDRDLLRAAIRFLREYVGRDAGSLWH